jgi:uncharacterized protein
MENIEKQIKKAEKVVVAYSGGVDSTLLAYLCKISGVDYIAITVDSEVFARSELRNAIKTAEYLGLKHKIIRVSLLKSQKFVENSQKRCYYCKKMILKEIKNVTKDRMIFDGTNADDMNDFRPGLRASQEMGVISPLRHLKKEEIRRLAKELGIPNWSKPSNSCLATRIIKEEITESKLRRAEEAEEIVKEFGFKLVRVRISGENAVVQVAKNRLDDLFGMREEIAYKLKKLGFQRVSFDSAGYPSIELQ